MQALAKRRRTRKGKREPMTNSRPANILLQRLKSLASRRRVTMADSFRLWAFTPRTRTAKALQM